MTITKVKNYTVSPYHDDYTESDNYHRVLFRPGFAVQARELTQLQTALQAQIDRHGQYSFNDGSRVVGGKVSLNVEYDFVKVEEVFTTGGTSYTTSGYLANVKGTTITGGTNGVQAIVLDVVGATGGDPNTLYIKYQNAGTGKTTKTFAAGEILTSSHGASSKLMVAGGTDVDGSGTNSAYSTPTGYGSVVNIEEGVYFISGCFAYVASQSLILDKYGNTPTYIVGLNVSENIISTTEDASLGDNATGTTNYAAPGANRYQISTSLIKESVTAPNTTFANYIILLKVQDGKVSTTITAPINTELTDRFARRTHEESGNYALKPFILDVKEHLDTGSNNGHLTNANGGVATKLAIGVEPSVSYVQGYRVENVATTYVAIDKPRGVKDYVKENANVTTLPIGNYVKLTSSSITGMPDINNYITLNLLNSSNATIGTARARGLERQDATYHRLYLFDITMSGSNSFTAVAKVSQTVTGQNFAGNLNPVGTRFDSGNNGLVFKLPYDAVKTLYDGSGVDTIYTVREKFTVTANATPQVSINITQGVLANTTNVLMSIAGNAPIVVPSGNIVGNGTNSVTINNTSAMTGFTNGASCQVILSVTKTNVTQIQKTKSSQITKVITANGSSSYGLDAVDIINIVSIQDASNVDVTDKFTLDNGQRDNFYEEGKIKLIAGNTVPNGNLTVKFFHFTHGTGDYFSVDSYADYEDIPTFDSSQGTVELRDCLDFRPIKSHTGATTGQEFSTGTGRMLTQTPLPGGIVIADITHYLGRIDKLFITTSGEFKVVEGVTDRKPTAPDDPADAMVIYNLHLLPYVFSPKDVVLLPVDNKRYTMKDIGKLDKRIKNLEYYTSLSLLEKEAADTQIFDGSNNSRFKNGFVVDGFYGHNVGNSSHKDYGVAIDKEHGILRPQFDERNVNLIRKSGDSGAVVKNGSLVTKSFTHSEWIKQPYGTYAEFVNPYNVFTWGGTMKLSPESDEWKEVDVRPDVTIDDNGIYDQFTAMAEESGILGTVWNEWETNWSGVETSTSGTFGIDIDERELERGRRGRGGRRVVTTTITTETTTSSQTRSGLTTSIVPETQLKDLGSKVVEVNFIPFMRSRKIWFKAELMKPDTRVYPFFNGQDVSNFVTETGGYLEFSDQGGATTYEGATGYPGGAGVLTTDSSGKVEGSFIIPRNSALKFKTGTREFRLTDDSANNKDNETTFAEAQYHAQGLLETQEKTIISTKIPKFVTSEMSDERTITDTKTRANVTTTWVDPVAQTFLVDQKGGLFVSKIDLFVTAKDANIPLNVSIRAVENGVPTQKIVPGTDVNTYPGSIGVSATGATATAITFDHPVYLEQDQEYAIVLISMSDDYKVAVAETGGFDMINTANRVTKQPYNGVFFTSANSSTWTPEQSKDLKFTLYRAEFATANQTITFVNDVIPPKPLGNNPFTYVSQSGGSSIIRIKHKNHGMYGASNKVTLAGCVAGNGLTAANLNGDHTIANIEHDSYTITVTGTSTTQGIPGGGSAVTATENRFYNLLHPMIQELVVPGTAISYSLNGYSGKSIDSGSEQMYSNNGLTSLPILSNSNLQFTSPLVIGSQINETNYMSGNKSFELTATFVNDNNYVSPVIDMNRLSATTVQNRVNDATDNSGNYSSFIAETTAEGTSNVAKYITKKIELADEADVINVYLNGNRPSSSNIDLYYKAVAAGSDVDFDSVAWIRDTDTTVTISNPLPVNDGGQYSEVSYAIDPAIGKFGAFAFKIVLRTSSSSNVPTCKDFRAIAST